MKLINKASNSVLLDKVPYVEFFDLAIVFIIYIPLIEPERKATITILNEYLELWGIEKCELYNIARKNCYNNNEAVISNMKDIIREMYIEVANVDEIHDDEINTMLDMNDNEKSRLYVLTNQSKYYGAVTMTYENIIRDFANEKESNVYILPSSIHEVLLALEENDMSVEQLREMVHTVNSTEVDEMEVLSHNVYYYDRYTDKFEIA